MGLLGLHNLMYFAENYTDTFRKIVSIQAERKERDYPVAVAGINISQMLCDLLRVFQDEPGGPTNIFPVLFDHLTAFEELYCISFRVLDNTWDEMNASYMDFPKVIAAVKKQIGEVLATNPSSLDQFNKVILSGVLSTNQIQIVEYNNEEPEPVRKFRTKIKQEMTEFFKQQRLSFLLDGAWFKSPKSKGKQTSFIYFRLAENKQDFLSGTSNTVGTGVPELTPLVKLSEILELLVGVNTPIFSKQKKLSQQDEEMASLSFSLLLKEQGKTIDFTASSKEDFINWTDGLKLLLSDKFENSDTLEEINSLTNMELRIRLLDLEGAQIPLQPPPIPTPLPIELLE